MSRVIDNRVVEMEFDNANFEKNVGTSLSTLDKLKAALSFRGVNTNFDSVEGSAISLGKSFSALEQMAIGAFRSMGDSVASWATRTIKEMSGVSNMINGFKKFSTITTSAATLNAQGFDTKDVEKQLDRLNWFTDETSYNLSDMVDNISKFTATGQSLENSSDAMMGIALWAAMSGQNAQTASRAMYQLSQAMSGFMKREDWRSIQNANMDTKEFREHALEAAVAIGTLKKNSQGLYMSTVEGIKKADKVWFSRDQFVENLTGGQWFTKDVMMSVYREYASAVNQIYDYTKKHVGSTVDDALEAIGDSLSEFGRRAFEAGQKARTWEDAINSVTDALSTKWMGVFKLIFGDAEEATDFFTDLSYSFYVLFVEPMNGKLAYLKKWADEFGGKSLREGILNTLESIVNVSDKIREAFDDIFYGDEIKELQREYSKETKALKLASEELGEAIPSYDNENEAKAEVKARGIIKITQAFKDWSDKLLANSENLSKFSTIVKGIAAIIDLGKQALLGAGSAIKEIFSGDGRLGKSILDLGAKIGLFFIKLDKSAKKADFFKKTFKTLIQPILNLKQAIKEFYEAFKPEFLERWDKLKSKLSELDFHIDKTGGGLKTFFGNLKEKWEGLFTNFDAQKAVDGIFNTIDKIKDLFYTLTGIEPGTLTEKLQKFIDDTIQTFDDFKATSEKKVKEIWKTIKDTFNSQWEWLKAHKEEVTQTLKDIFKGIGNFFSGFWSGIKNLFSKDKTDDGISNFQKFVDSLKSIGEALGKIVGFIVKAFTPLAEGLNKTFESMDADNAGEWIKGGGLVAIGIGIAKFAKSLKENSILSGISEILNGFGNVLDSFAHTLDAKALKEAAIAIAILVGSIFILISLPLDTVTTAGAVLASFVAVLAKSMKDIAKINSSISINGKGLSSSKSYGGKLFLQVAIGLVAIALALKMIAKIPADDLYNAVFTISIMVGIITLMLKAIAKIYANKGNTSKITNQNSGNMSILNNSQLIKTGGPAGIILGFAILIYAVAKSIEKMIPYIEKHLGAFLGSLGVVIAVVAGMALAIKLLTYTHIDFGMTTAIIGFAAAIYILASVVIKVADKIKDVGGTRVMWATAAVAGLMLLLTAFVGLGVVAKDINFNGYGTLVLSMIAFATIVSVLALIVKKLSEVEKNDKTIGLKAALGVVAGISALLIAFAGLTLIKTFDPSKMMKIAGAMTIFAAAIAVVSGVMYLMAQLEWDDIKKGISVLLSIAGVSAVLMIIANNTGDGIIKIGKAFILLAGAIALLGVAAAGFSAAMTLLSDGTINVKKVAENISEIIDFVIERFPVWFGKILTAIYETFMLYKAKMILGIIKAAKTMLDELDSDGNLSGIVDKALGCIITIIKGIDKRVTELVAAVGDFVLHILESLGNWLEANSDRIAKALDKFVGGLISIILHLFDPLGEKIFGDAWDDIANGIEGTVKPALELFATVWLVSWVAGVVATLNPILIIIGAIIAGLALIAKMDSLFASESLKETSAQREKREERLRAQYEASHPYTNDNDPLLSGYASRAEYDRMRDEWVQSYLDSDYDVKDGKLYKRYNQPKSTLGTSDALRQYSSNSVPNSKYQRTKNGSTEYLDTGSNVGKYKYTPYDADVAAFKPSQQGKNGGNSATVNYTQVNNMGNQVSTTDLFRQAKTTVGDMFTFDFSGLLGGENTGDIEKIIQKYGISGG